MATSMKKTSARRPPHSRRRSATTTPTRLGTRSLNNTPIRDPHAALDSPSRLGFSLGFLLLIRACSHAIIKMPHTLDLRVLQRICPSPQLTGTRFCDRFQSGNLCTQGAKTLDALYETE